MLSSGAGGRSAAYWHHAGRGEREAPKITVSAGGCLVLTSVVAVLDDPRLIIGTTRHTPITDLDERPTLGAAKVGEAIQYRRITL